MLTSRCTQVTKIIVAICKDSFLRRLIDYTHVHELQHLLQSCYTVPSSFVINDSASLSVPEPISLKAVTVKLYVTPGWRLSINSCSSCEMTVLFVPLRKRGCTNSTLSCKIEEEIRMVLIIKSKSASDQTHTHALSIAGLTLLTIHWVKAMICVCQYMQTTWAGKAWTCTHIHTYTVHVHTFISFHSSKLFWSVQFTNPTFQHTTNLRLAMHYNTLSGSVHYREKKFDVFMCIMHIREV